MVLSIKGQTEMHVGPITIFILPKFINIFNINLVDSRSDASNHSPCCKRSYTYNYYLTDDTYTSQGNELSKANVYYLKIFSSY